MALTLPYPTIDQFISTTVHSSSAHNTPHNKLLANDVAIASAINTLETSVAAIDPGYIETIPLNIVSGTGVYPNFTRSRNFSYTYTGAYIPISILINVVIYAGGSTTMRNQVKWQNASGADLTTFIDYVGLNPFSAGDGGAGLNDAFSATIPFIVGSKTIQFYDVNGAFGGVSWMVLALTYQKLSRPVAWGY